jgi:hypothetical protein
MKSRQYLKLGYDSTSNEAMRVPYEARRIPYEARRVSYEARRIPYEAKTVSQMMPGHYFK